jgi:transcriptional regulator with XRE-family HTH domain
MSQEALAEAADMSAHYISLIENGHRLVSLNVMDRIATALHVSLADLVKTTHAQPPAGAEIASLLQSMSETERAISAAVLLTLVRQMRKQSPSRKRR